MKIAMSYNLLTIIKILEYLAKVNQQQILAIEAKRQSIVASQTSKNEDHDWEMNSDDSSWQ